MPALSGDKRPPPPDSALGAIERAVPTISGTIRGAPGQPNPLQIGLLALLGKQTDLEGKPAVAMPLKFTDGAVTLGPIPVGTIPPLY